MAPPLICEGSPRRVATDPTDHWRYSGTSAAGGRGRSACQQRVQLRRAHLRQVEGGDADGAVIDRLHHHGGRPGDIRDTLRIVRRGTGPGARPSTPVPACPVVRATPTRVPAARPGAMPHDVACDFASTETSALPPFYEECCIRHLCSFPCALAPRGALVAVALQQWDLLS